MTSNMLLYKQTQIIYFLQSNDETRQQTREYEETKKQIEEDADREILDIKNKYERRLRDEKESNMRLKGETGIMKKKVGVSVFRNNPKNLSAHIFTMKMYLMTHS